MSNNEQMSLFYLTGEIDRFVRVCVNSMDGDIDYAKIGMPEFPKTKPNQVYIGATLISDGVPISRKEERTPTRDYVSKAEWNEWILFPIQYKDLSEDAIIVLRVYCYHTENGYVPVGDAVLPLFGYEKGNVLRKGTKRVKVENCKTLSDEIALDIDEYERLRVQRVVLNEKEPRYNTKKNALERAEKYQTKMVSTKGRMDFLDQFTASIVPAFRQEEERRTGSLIYISITIPEFDNPVKLYKNENDPGHFPTVTSQGRMVECGPVQEIKFVGENLEIAGEKMYMKLTSSLDAKGMGDNKPVSINEYKELDAISRMPASVTLLNGEQKALLRRYGRYLAATNPKALNIFLAQAIDWEDLHEVEEAKEFVKIWQKVDVEDALGLLSIKDSYVREYAVERLKSTTDEEFGDYLFSFVQALRQEKEEKRGMRFLIDYLIDRCKENFVLGNWFYWYLTVECGCKDGDSCDFYKWVRDTFDCNRNAEHKKETEKQRKLIEEITKLQLQFINSPLSRPEKLEQLKEWIESPTVAEIFSNGAIALPLNPRIYVKGINSKGAFIFKSNKAPLKLPFIVDPEMTKIRGGIEYDQKEFLVIVKHGDDLRQDQLIGQMISLMDRLLKKDLMDLKLTPYHVVATSPVDGMVEFIPSDGMGDIIKDGTIRDYLMKMNGGSIPTAVTNNFVRSVSGNSVITYLLGVGDRHLDNLLVRGNGIMFHIDFGYILGKECKPFPPPMKLCKEIVEGMGGKGSPQYQEFTKLCCECYNSIRKSSKLIMNLFQLMTNSNIAVFQEMGQKCINKLKEKLRMDLTDERAAKFMVGLIETSVNALFPVFVDSFHDFVQYWKS
ncbi:phosphatidylinositol 3-kinase class, putative [Entamoeba invadens IP1]|uniref:phosphatidylinositol 3-kinase n=1 Tax=Entamoeba invadens IP1 TaxID=370355 RepID=A0A0A1TVB5_ENTIV|nr:phosphatidylinositol 3-kinase class, putative [Entamoeba invadens IP1]ELP84266.1 phosphatidylinositol 3-kinase class, putative [Entamoeba invadens IP1]|eukprot:XP_004183612.1 phosphatidylinositol 3-kinase class, putative [Entamoeba invadens IP1]